MKRPLFDASLDELSRWCVSVGEPTYRARQIRDWVGKRGVTDFARMSDLPARLRLELAREWTPLGSQLDQVSIASDQTRKLLLRLADGKMIETVLLAEETRRTVCTSTQVGCPMGCVFCASGQDGLERNLSTAEIIEQWLHVRAQLPGSERLSHIVVMGMGEPLLNLEPLLSALAFATADSGLGISARHVTISTVGLPAKIRQLGQSGRPYHLAISLHAPVDSLRRQIIPTAAKVPLADLLSAADAYRESTGRQVTFEYVLLADLNDRPQHARQLATLLAGRDPLVNLIPYNSVTGLGFRRPSADRVRQFASLLRQAGFVVKIRKRKGDAIEAACGQLRQLATKLAVSR